MSERRAIVALAAAVALSGAAGALAAPAGVRMPGPAPEPRAPGYDVADENARCESCHADIAEEWRSSLHRRSWDDEVFLTAYAIEPQPFCRSCHVPEADPASSPGEAERRIGVGCVTCHVDAGKIVGARASGESPHDLDVDARFATEAACDGCHEFDFPEPQLAPMQGTADEHRASARASTSCEACHMPLVSTGGGRAHHRHDFRIAGNADALKLALDARAEREGDRAIVVTLSAARAGHDLPTGDMFRRLEVRARVAGGGGEAQPVVLARRFVVTHDDRGFSRIQVGDDRVRGTGEAKRVRLELGADPGDRAVDWEIVYQRMDPFMARAFGVDPAKDEIVVASGELAAPRNAAHDD